jgi:hypothetical protein
MSNTNNNIAHSPAALHLLCAAHFQPLLQQDFCIRFTSEIYTAAQLEQVLEWNGHSELERKPFSILLQTDQKTTYYPQAIYTVEHPALGPLAIFLVPVGVKGRGMQYEAVFS